MGGGRGLGIARLRAWRRITTPLIQQAARWDVGRGTSSAVPAVQWQQCMVQAGLHSAHLRRVALQNKPGEDSKAGQRYD